MDFPVEERLRQVLQHLGVDRAHFAGRLARDWSGLAAVYPTLISSLTLVGPLSIDLQAVENVASRLLVVHGDGGPTAERVRSAVENLSSARSALLRDYAVFGWTDVTADRGDEIVAAITDLIVRTAPAGPQIANSVAREGEIAGISYRIVGAGPPLVLLPLWLSPSQWDPIVQRLSQRCCTITLGGPALGAVAILESRGRAAGYRRMLRTLIDETEIQPGETVLEVGSGTGAIGRWLAAHTGRRNRIVGVDINGYLLREATALVRTDGLDKTIEFREGSALALPFSDNTFNVTMSVTVIEEVEADRMLTEMVRVTRPGGRVAVISRAMDLPFQMNLPVSVDLKRKLEAPGVLGMVESHGCADASLYRRLHRAGLTRVKMFPQSPAFDGSEPELLRFMIDGILPKFERDEIRAWQSARALAEANGTFFITWPHHCAVGTKR